MTQEELGEIFDVSRVTIWSAVKRLMKLGIIEGEKLSMKFTNNGKYLKDGYYKDHTYSYTLKESKMAVTNVKLNIKNLTSNDSYLNNKLFKYKSLINHDNEITKKDTREIPQVAEENPKTPSVITAPAVTVQEMYDVANEVLGEKLSFRLTKEIAWMGAARNAYFQTLEKWRRFLEAIKKSWYLMGEKFLLTIKWVLKFKTIEKISAGEYDSFEEKKKRRAEEWNKKLEEEREKRKEKEEEWEILETRKMAIELENSEESPKCIKARYELFRKVGVPSFRSWFSKANLVEEHGRVIMEVESNFKFDWIGNKYREVLESLNIGLRKANG